MNRLDCLQILIKQKKFKQYLEVGVKNGHVFFKIRCASKVGVDPNFVFDKLRLIGKIFLSPGNLSNRYFCKTSDEFFKQDAATVYAGKGLQIALIDGMHEYQCVLRDIENSLLYLTDDGVIILHDCNPRTRQASCSFLEWEARGFDGEWNGDVWKAVLHLRTCRPDLSVFVLDCDYGVGIVTKRPSEALPRINKGLDQLNFEDLEANRMDWLNLKPTDYFYEYFNFKKNRVFENSN